MARVLQVSTRMAPARLPEWQVQRFSEAVEQHNAQQEARFEAVARIRREELLQVAGDYAARSALGMSYAYRRERERAELKAEMVMVVASCVALVALIVAVVGR